MLFQTTLIIDLVAMAATLWGAFYLFARGFPSRLTLRAVIVSLLLSIFFLGAYSNLFHQVKGTAAIRAVLLILGLGSWYSLTYQLMSKQSRERYRPMEVAIYVLAGVTALALVAIPDAFIDEQGNDLYVAHMSIGFPYILYGIFQVAIVLGMLYNLLAGDKIGLTRQGKYFLVASVFPGLAVVSGVVGLAILPRLPRIVPDLFIFSGMFLLGISIARHQALVERRTTLQDLPISFLAILGLAGLYAYFALRWGVPFERIGAVVAFAVLTHSAYDLAREVLERQRIRHEGTFRRQLRRLENQSTDEEALRARLQQGLDLLCETLQAAGGFIALRHDEEFMVIATRNSIVAGVILAPTLVTAGDMTRPETDQLPGIAWIAPAFEGQTQVAVIALGMPQAKPNYSTGDLDLLAEVADQVGTIVSLHNRERSGQTRQLANEAQASDSKTALLVNEMIATISTNPDKDFVKMVEDGLRHFSDYIVLGQSPLADWVGIQTESHVERGKQLQKLLNDSIELLRPAEKRPGEPLPRVWYSYAVLHDAYVEGAQNREIMARLYISEGTFNRTRRNAIRGLARLLIEKKEQ
jgi:hypothetical protein